MATISIQGSRVSEGTSSFTFTVSLSAPTADAVTVRYRTVPGTAIEGDDYGRQPSFADFGTLSFLAGETQKTIRVFRTFDREVEFDESVVLELFDPTGADLPAGQAVLRGTSWILDDDNLGNARALYVSNPVVREGDTGVRSADFTISLSQAFTSDVQLAYTTRNGTATAGQDYTARSGVVTFFAGQLEAVVSVPVTGDQRIEGPEYFYLDVTPSPGIATPAGTTGIATILDDDNGNRGPVISAEPAQVSEGASSVFVTVSLSRPFSEQVAVKYRTVDGTASSSSDYSATGLSREEILIFAPGETSKSVRLFRTFDRIEEPDEYFFLELYDPTNATFGGGQRALRTPVTILDDDGVGTKRAIVVTNPIVEERVLGQPTIAVFDVLLTRPSSERITLSYQTVDQTARAGVDYVARSGNLVFEAGQTRASVVVPILSDTVLEASETFLLRILPPYPAQIAASAPAAIGTATIADSSITGTANSDVLQGTAGPDAIFGLGGNDRIFGLAGNDRLDGGAGNDELQGGLGDDGLIGGIGNDILNGGPGADVMIGGPGNDTYIIDALDRLIEAAGGGIDTVVTAGSYRLPVHFENLRLVGTAPVNGTGNAANNLIVGNGAANVLSGEGGNDRLLGGGGNDRLFGGPGNDTLDGQAGADFMVGGPGNDTYTVDNRGDRVVEAANGGTDTVRSTISLGLAAHVENLTLLGNRPLNGTGNAGDNVLRGNNAANTLSGGGGNDLLLGLGGPDRLIGGAGNDVLVGGAGRDVQTGGPGSDIFFFSSWSDSGRGAGRDVITDFTAIDTLDLRGIDARPGVPGNQAFVLVPPGTLGGRQGELTLRPGLVQADRNGDGIPDLEIATPGFTLTAADVLL